MSRHLLAPALLLALLAAAPAAEAATVTLDVRPHAGEDPVTPSRPAKDGTPVWHVTSERGVGLVGTIRDDLGLVPWGGRCRVVTRVLSTGRQRVGDDCVVDDDGTFSASVTATRHVRVHVVLLADPGDEEHPVAAATASAPVELRVRPSIRLEDVYTAGRRLDGRLIVRFNGYVVSTAPPRAGRVLLQRRRGTGFVTVAAGRPRSDRRVTFETLQPKPGAYRIVWRSPDRRSWDDASSRPLVYRR